MADDRTAAAARRVGVCFAGKYEIVRLLACGSMADVYEATHLQIGRRVAIKVIAPGLHDSPEIEERFRREARAAGAIESEFVAQILDAGRDHELGLYIVLEMLVGEDLEVRLARSPRMDPSEAVRIAYQVARGIAKAHAAGIVHRDLKPGNIFLNERDDGDVRAKILDFGISRLMWSDSSSAITAYGSTVGTPLYMSPEQVRGIPDLDGRTDVWSLAAVLYEMLSGAPPFPLGEDSFADLLVRIVREYARPLRSVAPWVDPVLAQIVDSGLVRDRDARIADVEELARQLALVDPTAARGTSGVYSVPAPESAIVADPLCEDPVCFFVRRADGVVQLVG
jgi:serine/threonine protein kinase